VSRKGRLLSCGRGVGIKKKDLGTFKIFSQGIEQLAIERQIWAEHVRTVNYVLERPYVPKTEREQPADPGPQISSLHDRQNRLFKRIR